MRGEDLLQQGRAGTRQADDEDRVGPVAAETLPRRQEIWREQRFLQPDIAVDRLGAIADLALLQRIAALVTAEGLAVVAAILQRLAEREAEMIAVDRRGLGPRLLRLHAGDLVLGETIGLEIGQAPISVAEARPAFGRLTV